MRRAISPIIAAVLLVIIAVAAGVMVWVWLSGYAQKNPTAQPALNERFRIDSVEVNTDADRDGDFNDTVAYVTNIGDVKVTIKAFYIIDGVTGIIRCANYSVKDVTIAPGSSASVYILRCSTKLGNLTSGNVYIAKVVSSNGVEAVYSFVAP